MLSSDNYPIQMRAKILQVFFVSLFLCFGVFSAVAQGRNRTYEAYVKQYADEAIRQMSRYNIPASITMAQALVETGAGASTLASVHNNHFGIKCHRSWTGKRTYRTDDAPDECFRSYSHSRESYEDHSRFLLQPRYRSLFDLRRDDYRGWATGLQRCGYATNRGYANLLIKMVEVYELYALDRERYPSWFNKSYPGTTAKAAQETKQKAQSGLKHEAYFSYGLLYIVAKAGDTFDSLAEEFDISASRLARYNDAPTDFPLEKGDVVYLEKKNSRSVSKYTRHVVRVGDSMHSISQRYGIRLKNLYKLNDKDGEYIPQEGDVLRLR